MKISMTKVLGFGLAAAALAMLASQAAMAAASGAGLSGAALENALDMAKTGNLGRGIGAGLAAGLGVVGAGLGVGRIGGSSVEAVARQPEAAGTIFTNMIITAGMVEGAALFAIVGGFIALL